MVLTALRFATNVILPSLAYVYWQNDTDPWRETLINSMTLGGSVVGQLLFGILADVKGRTSLYGVELVIVIFSTIGVASASSGIGNNMSILGWLVVWRFVMGIGIGAEQVLLYSSQTTSLTLLLFRYPLSAVITAEWSSSKARARMMSAVFFMQPIGQLMAQLVGLWVILGRQSHLQSHCSNDRFNQLCRAEVDRIWRIVTGVGAAPALLAIIFRFLIWDAGLYVWEVKQDIPRAIRNSQNVYPNIRPRNGTGTMHLLGRVNMTQPAQQEMPVQFSREDLRYYFINQGNWRYLAGTSICWFLLDFA
jgi:PHS family inorganic phosphate transporter-like MFS transporter